MTHRSKRRLRVGRDTFLFLLGAGGFINELIRSGAERPTILLLCAAMMGLPAFLWRDETHLPRPPAESLEDRDADADV